MRVVMAKGAVDHLRAGRSAAEAAALAVAELAARTGGQGGIILVDHTGAVAQARNTARMPWASVVDGVAGSDA